MHTLRNTAAITITLAAVLTMSGCLVPARRSVTRPTWGSKFNKPLNVTAGRKTVLRISADGTKWEWHAKPEAVVTALIDFIMSQEQKFLSDLQKALSAKEPVAPEGKATEKLAPEKGKAPETPAAKK